MKIYSEANSNRVKLVITTKDLMRLLDCSYSKAWREMRYIRDVLGKGKHQYVTTDDVAQVLGIPGEVIVRYLTR